MNKNTVDTEELSRVLRVSKVTLVKYRANGMPCYRAPGQTRGKFLYDLQEVFKWLKREGKNGKVRD